MESISSSDDIMIETFLSFIKTGHRGFLTIICANKFNVSSLTVSINSKSISFGETRYHDTI
jgi:hypothetical protein